MLLLCSDWTQLEAVNQLFRDTVNSGNTFDPETAFKTDASKKTWKDTGVNFISGSVVRGGLQALSLHSGTMGELWISEHT